MEESYYKQRLNELDDLTKESFDKQAQFYQHALLVSSGVLGILVSLRSNSSDDLYIRLVFLLTVLLLGFGILACSITVHTYAVLTERVRQAYVRELQRSLREDCKAQICTVDMTKTERWVEKLSKLLLLLSMISLISYSVLLSL